MNICKLKNMSGSTQDIVKWWDIDEEFLIQDTVKRTLYSNSSAILTAIANKILVVNDGDNDITDINAAIDYLKGTSKMKVDIDSSPTFSAKITNDGRKLFRRKHGFSIIVQANSNVEETLTVPYNQAKINEVEFVNGVVGDKVDFKVYDSVTGIYQQILGVPAESVDTNLLLNQFGFETYIPNGYYKDISSYDADLVGGMRIRVRYYNNSSEEVIIYGNVVYHEVK